MEKNTSFKLSITEIIEILMESKSEVRRLYKTDIRGVFGSFVKGEATETSDIDVLVEFDKGANLLDLTGASIFLEDRLNHTVDLVPESSLRVEFKEDILKETLYL